jgi:uncharacterized phiE125 gp8 family phage protein
MPLYLVTGPTEVLSLVDAKLHLRVEDSENDAVITAMVAAATADIDGRDGWLGRALKPQTWDLKLDGFPCGHIRLPLPPLISVTSVEYIDIDGITQTFSATKYHVSGAGGRNPARISLRAYEQWPLTAYRWPEPVTVRFEAGYEIVPPDIVNAIKLQVSQYYENRDEFVTGTIMSKLPSTVESLLLKHQVFA